MAGKIFINYRRGDDPGHTGRLFDWLQDVFDRDQLFLDVDNIAPGLDFVRELDQRVGQCDVMLAVIGKGWIDARDAGGARRLDDPNDFVRVEIASALKQGKIVIPVLVGDVQMPRPEELPDELKPLARRNAARLTHERFSADVQGLVKALQQTLGQNAPATPIRFQVKERASVSSSSLGTMVFGGGIVGAVVIVGVVAYFVWTRVSTPVAPAPVAGHSQVAAQSAPISTPTVPQPAQVSPAAHATTPDDTKPEQQHSGSATTPSDQKAEKPLPPDLVTDCDRLAGDPLDQQLPAGAGGVILVNKIDVVAALNACAAATQQYPSVARFAYEAGRIASAQKDFDAARQMYEKAIALGSSAALSALGNLYEYGSGVPKDYTKALQLFQKSAAARNPNGMQNLGYAYENGFGVTVDYAQARQWYERAAEVGNPISMLSLGYLYRDGKGVTTDYAQAAQWFEKAAVAGNSYGLMSLGLLYQYSVKNFSQARQWYEKAAAAGDVDAMGNLGGLYATGGPGLEKNPTLARHWDEQCAAAGSAWCMNTLGGIYQNGLGVDQDYATAIQWYLKSALAGNSGAMNNLAFMYAKGFGSPKNLVLARQWFEKAAAAGNPSASHNLEVLDGMQKRSRN